MATFIPCRRRSPNCANARSKAMLGGGEERLEKQRQGGKLTARERVEALVDPDSFEETRTVRRASRHVVRHGRERAFRPMAW